MAATYPDIFAGVGVIAGTEFKAATGVQGGLAAMKSGGQILISKAYLRLNRFQACHAKKTDSAYRFPRLEGSLRQSP
jgi:poly(3-hydroxybutyrate) depolymerase